jgi:hypothetical protein
MSSKTAKRRGRPIIVDGVRYYWKVKVSFGALTVYVLLPTGRRVEALYCDVTEKKPDYYNAPPHGGLEITPSDVATFIRRTVSQ